MTSHPSGAARIASSTARTGRPQIEYRIYGAGAPLTTEDFDLVREVWAEAKKRDLDPVLVVDRVGEYDPDLTEGALTALGVELWPAKNKFNNTGRQYKRF